MTTSVPMTERRQRGGFTLLELIVTLSIAAIFVGTAFSFTHPRSRKVAEKFDVELQVYVRDSRTSAREKDQSVYLHFTPDSIYRSSEASVPDEEPETGALPVPSGFELFFAEGSRWDKITKSTPYVHLFSRSGITEPFGIRFQNEDAEFDCRFDALSALPMEGDP